MKNIYFIRHGEAIHNPPVEKYGKSILIDEKYFDAQLTETGVYQCAKLDIDKYNIDVVFASPLTRTLQTASIIFKDYDIQLHALERIRERFGVRPCDRRHSTDSLKTRFPNISFNLCQGHNMSEDPIWKSNYRETEEELEERIKEFLLWIKQRPEKNIAIVTHQGYMIRLYRILKMEFPAPKNCEIIHLKC